MPRKSMSSRRRKPVRRGRFTGHHAARLADQAVEREKDELDDEEREEKDSKEKDEKSEDEDEDD